MDEEQFRAAMELDEPTIEDIENIAKEKKNKSEAENQTAHENNKKAEEEAKRKEREEAERKAKEDAEKLKNQSGFSSDDFFNNIWNAPHSNQNQPENEDHKKDDQK